MKTITVSLLFMFIGLMGLKAQELTIYPAIWGEQYFQDKERISCKQFNMLLEENPVSATHWKKSKKQLLGALIAGAANAGSAAWYLRADDQDNDTTGPIIAFAGTAIIGSIFYWSANKNKRKAVLEYNDSLGKKTSYRFVPVSNQNGLGLALKF